MVGIADSYIHCCLSHVTHININIHLYFLSFSPQVSTARYSFTYIRAEQYTGKCQVYKSNVLSIYVHLIT